MPPKPALNVQNFPRPPLLERTPRHLQVRYNGHVIADTKEAFWVLETWHAPTYYLPTSSLLFPLTPTPKSSFCEWKGNATYYSITLPSSPPSTVENRIWAYEAPSPGFSPIQGYVSFYAGPWQCFVDGEEVLPQPGDFYGGWVTQELVGLVKGGVGTLGL